MNATPPAPPPFSARFFNFNGPFVMPPGSDIQYLGPDRGVTDVAAFQHFLQWSADFCKFNGLFDSIQGSGLLVGRVSLDPRIKLKILFKLADSLYDLWDPEDTLDGVLDEVYLFGLDRLQREVRDRAPVLWQPEPVL